MKIFRRPFQFVVTGTSRKKVEQVVALFTRKATET